MAYMRATRYKEKSPQFHAQGNFFENNIARKEIITNFAAYK